MKNLLIIIIAILLGSNAFLLYKNFIGKSSVPTGIDPIHETLAQQSTTTPLHEVLSAEEEEGIVEDSSEILINTSSSTPSAQPTKPAGTKPVSVKKSTTPKVDDRYQPFTFGVVRVPNSPYISIVKDTNKTVVIGDPLTIRWSASSTIKEIHIDFFSTENITARAPNDIIGIFAKSGSATFTFNDQTPIGTFAFRICKSIVDGEAHCQNAPYKITIVRPSISFIYPDEKITIGKNVVLGIRWKAVLPQKYKNSLVDIDLLRYRGRTFVEPAEVMSPLETKYPLATGIINTGSYGFDIAKSYKDIKNIFGNGDGPVRVVPRVCIKDATEEGFSRTVVCTGVIDGWAQPDNYIEITE